MRKRQRGRERIQKQGQRDKTIRERERKKERERKMCVPYDHIKDSASLHLDNTWTMSMTAI